MRFSVVLLLSCLPACSTAVESESTSQTCSELVTDNRLASNKLAANRLASNRLAQNRLASNRLAQNRLAQNRLASNRLAQNRLASNRLAQNRLAQNRLAQNRLAQNRLATNRIELDESAVADLLATADGREVFGYIVGCAIPEGQTLVANHGGTTYEFEGSLGLAPDWVTQPLDHNGQRWVSSCLLARVNAAGVMVEVSLRGAHDALSTTPEELATWTLEEGAFWGNVFDTELIDWNACRGLDQAAGESGQLADRDCTEPDAENPGFTLCGFRYAGDCGDFAAQPACRSFDAEGMHYESCTTVSRCSLERYPEVITTFAKP
jgi:hypothetical protein